MTNPSHEPEGQGLPQKTVRIILPREVCTDPETAAKIMHGEIQKALKTLRGGSGSTPPDTSRAEEDPGVRAGRERDAAWLRAARRARWLAWASLVWMMLEGGLGVVAGVEANSISVLTWAASSAVEGLASVIVIWRFTGHRTLSEHSERRAQRWVAASFFLLVPYILFESIHRLINGTQAEATALAIALTASSVVLMPLLGWAKLRLGQRLGSAATAGEGVQNLLCAAQALAALVAVVAAGAGVALLDPLAALAIAAIAAKEGIDLWRGEECGCHTVPGSDTASGDLACRDDCCHG